MELPLVSEADGWNRLGWGPVNHDTVTIVGADIGGGTGPQHRTAIAGNGRVDRNISDGGGRAGGDAIQPALRLDIDLQHEIADLRGLWITLMPF